MTRRGRPPHPDILTPRQWEVLALLREGLSDQEIADRLGLSLPGAKYHVSEILSKLGVPSREEVAAWQPAEPRPARRRFVALPLAAKLGAVAVVSVAVAGLALLAWGVAVTSVGGQEEARDVANRAVAAMEALDSYRVTPSGGWGQAAVADFQSPDRIAWYGWSDRDGAAIITIGTTDYWPLRSPEGDIYWKQRSRGDGRTFGVGPPQAGPHLPQWRHMALELADNLEIVGITREEAGEFFRLRARVNPVFAWLENQRRFYEATGIGWVVPSCDDEDFVRDERFYEGEPQCWEELLEVSRSYDSGTIEAWISTDTFLVHRTEIRWPDEFDTEHVEVAEYSHFNEIEVEVPEDIRPRRD